MSAAASGLAGFASSSVIGAALFFAWPASVDGPAPVKTATLWTASGMAELPLSKPLVEPSLVSDDSDIYVVDAIEVSAERYDPVARAFMSTQPPTVQEHHSGDSMIMGAPKGAVQVTLDDGRIAAFSIDMTGASLFIAGRAAFRQVPMSRLVATTLTTLAGLGAAGSRILVLTGPYAENTATYVIDVDSGQVTRGPTLPRPANASSIWAARGVAVPGGMLIVDNGNVSGLEHPARNAVAAAVLLIAIIAIVAGLATKKLTPRPFLLGAMIGVVVLAIVAVSFVMSAVGARH